MTTTDQSAQMAPFGSPGSGHELGGKGEYSLKTVGTYVTRCSAVGSSVQSPVPSKPEQQACQESTDASSTPSHLRLPWCGVGSICPGRRGSSIREEHLLLQDGEREQS